MRTIEVTSARTWPIWFGTSGTVIAVVAMAVLGARIIFDGTVPPSHIGLHEPMQWLLRGAFLLIALGALWRLRSPLSVPWRWAVGGAVAMLACGVTAELIAAIARMGWSMDFSVNLGEGDSLERRLCRLAAMAAYAVPMLVLLAASEPKPDPAQTDGPLSARLAAFLVRWEPLLFAIGALTLATILLGGALIHKELTWLSPIGADTTVAGCAAAAIRARRRGDDLAFRGWLGVCISMVVGLLMGSYSFGGPLATPTLIGDYNSLARMLLRDGHVILMSIGIAGIAVAVARSHDEGTT